MEEDMRSLGEDVRELFEQFSQPTRGEMRSSATRKTSSRVTGTASSVETQVTKVLDRIDALDKQMQEVRFAIALSNGPAGGPSMEGPPKQSLDPRAITSMVDPSEPSQTRNAGVLGLENTSERLGPRRSAGCPDGKGTAASGGIGRWE